MSANEQPDLLFFDTFSHDTSEELNLDLVQFPKSVYVREIRIIPLGARVEGDFPGGVRLGATNPTKFHIDFFVNDLSKPGASTFEALGSLDYCQNGQIHMECGNGLDQPRIPTDGLVLRGWYTTITLAVYGTLTQVLPETPVGANPPSAVQRPTVTREVVPPPPVVPQNPEWPQETSNPIPAYTGNVATANPDAYGPSNYPENYDNQMYRGDYYEAEPPASGPKDPRTYQHMEEGNWDKRDLSCEREGDRLRHSPRSIDHDRDRDRRDGRSRRRSMDRGRSRESSRHRDRSREMDRMDRLRSRSRSRDRDYVVKGEYRPLSRSRSRSGERMRGLSNDRDWDRGSYKKDDYRRHREPSYDRSRGGSYDKETGSYERRSPYDKRGPSYERKIPYEKRLSPYEKRGSSYERRAPSYEKQSSYDRKRHSPYSRIRGSSYGSRSPSRDDPRKRPRTPPGEVARRPLSPRDVDASSPINSIRSEDGGDYDRSGKQIPRVDFYHQSYRLKPPIRSPSQEAEAAPFVEQQHSSLVTVQIVDNATAKVIESPIRNQDEDRSMDAEQFEPILSDEDICDDLEGPTYTELDYDVNDYCGVDDIIKYYNPFKCEWNKYEYVNKIHLLGPKKEGIKDVLNATFDELCDASPELFKISEMAKSNKKLDQKFFANTFAEIDNPAREEWVHQCEQLCVAMANLCKNTDIVLRIFKNPNRNDVCDEFTEIYYLLVTFCKIGLNFDFALTQQQPTYKIRHLKCGIRITEVLMSHLHNGEVTKVLLASGIDMPMLLIEMYAKEYMALSIRLMILKALNACLSSKESVEHFMRETVFPKFDKNDDRKPRNGYQALISMMQTDPLARLKFSISALIKKLNIYELLQKLHDLVINFSKSGGSDDAELSDTDVHFIVNTFEEILYMYRAQCFHLSQPKRFLPVSAQFEINKECSNEILLEYFDIHKVLEVCLYLLTCPTTCNNLVIVSPIHDLLHELINSHNGLNFLYKNMEISELLFKTLTQPYSQQNSEEFLYPHDLSNYSDLQILALEMAYKLKALYYLQSICDIQMGKTDENELIDRLQSLYCLSFGSVGKTAVPDVIVMENNADCLMEVFESDLKLKTKSESLLKQKSPAKGYAIELIVSAVRFAANVPFLKKYGQRLINVSREHDRFEPSVSSVLQEVIPYLKPVEKPTVLSGEDMAECVEILKASSEHAPDLPGELMTCLRILRHFCISDYDNNVTIACESATEEYVELKYKYNVLQLFSLDGVAHLAAVLERLAIHFDQPSMHTSFFASIKGLHLAQILLPCLRLLDAMLARVVRCRGPRFRDLTAAPVLLKTYGIAKAFPVGSVGYRTAAKAAEASVRALLAYAQPIADDANDGDSIRRGPWTTLCSEVISYIMTAPYTFVPGLLVFSELLPLPLPMQTKTPPTERELADAANERRLWSAHLHALSNDLTDMIQIICISTYRPVVHMLRRVCVQIADLAPNTAATVARAAVGAVTRELKPGESATASIARVLGFLACLVSHAPVKCAVLHAMNSGGPRATDVQTALCSVLGLANASNEHAAAQEYAAHALAAFCDAEITLTPMNGASDVILANSLPNKDALVAFMDATADCLESTTKTCSVASSILRAYFVLTEHEYGFQQFRKFIFKRRESLGKFFKWALEGQGEEKAECLSLYLDLIRILKMEEGESAIGRKTMMTVNEMADMVGYLASEEDHPVLRLEKILRERNFDEDAIANANFLTNHLLKIKSTEEPVTPCDVQDLVLPSPESLVAQFQSRTIYAIGEASDERLTSSYWLNVPAAGGEDDGNDSELVSCDIMEIANAHVVGGGEALCGAVRRLAGCLHAPPDPAPTDDKRPPVAWSRGRAEGCADAFRSRPPNTSRPPSLHVDDFTALHQPYTSAQVSRYVLSPPVAWSRGRADAFRSRPPNTSRPPSLHVDDFTALHQPYTSAQVSRYVLSPPVAWSRGRADAFRSRPPNTSRPPSLHVDDFTALHQPYTSAQVSRYVLSPPVAWSRGRADAFRSRPPNTSRPPSLHVDDFTALHQPYTSAQVSRYVLSPPVAWSRGRADAFRSRPPNTSRPPSLHVDDFTALHQPYTSAQVSRYVLSPPVAWSRGRADAFRSRPPNTSRPPSLHVDDFTALHQPYTSAQVSRYVLSPPVAWSRGRADAFRSRPPNTSRPPSLHVDDFTALHQPYTSAQVSRYVLSPPVAWSRGRADAFRSRPPNTSRPPSLHVDDFTALHQPYTSAQVSRYVLSPPVAWSRGRADAFRSRPPNTSRPPSLHVDDFTALHQPYTSAQVSRYVLSPPVAWSRGRADAFRSRPPNTSRPPSLHVDDFTALHQPYTSAQVSRYVLSPPVAWSRGRADAFRSRPPNTSRPPSLHVDDFTALHQPYTSAQVSRYVLSPPVAWSRGRADAFRSRPPNTSRPPSLHVDDFTALHQPYTSAQVSRYVLSPPVAWSRGRADAFRSRPPNTSRPPSLHVDDFTALHQPYTSAQVSRGSRRGLAVADRGRFASAAPQHHYRHLRGRGAWEMGAAHFGHFPPASQYIMGAMGWGGARMQRGRHRSFMR